jgi:hypothetical protein
MRTKIKYVLVLLALMVFVSGCKTTFLVHDANVKHIIPLFKDFVDFHGYTLRYKNDHTGSYNVDMGVVYIPSVSETEKTSTVIADPQEGRPHHTITAYEQTTWHTVSTPARHVEARASVNIIQQGTGVLIDIDTNDSGGPSLDDLRDYLQSLGYTIENK